MSMRALSRGRDTEPQCFRDTSEIGTESYILQAAGLPIHIPGHGIVAAGEVGQWVQQGRQWIHCMFQCVGVFERGLRISTGGKQCKKKKERKEKPHMKTKQRWCAREGRRVACQKRGDVQPTKVWEKRSVRDSDLTDIPIFHRHLDGETKDGGLVISWRSENGDMSAQDSSVQGCPQNLHATYEQKHFPHAPPHNETQLQYCRITTTHPTCAP